MTYCLGLKVKEGLLALADTRITSGTQTTSAKKISVHQAGGNKIFLMTSGLRSVRDKAVTYFDELLDVPDWHFTKMHQAVTAFGNQLRRVKDEDKKYLQEAGLVFNLYSIVGGRLKDDTEHKLFLLYPEGNWIEIGAATPFTIIGNSGYGMPILNRVINMDVSLPFALKTALLSFDSTRVSANDVGFPIDVLLMRSDGSALVERRYEEREVSHITKLWSDSLSTIISNIPDLRVEEYEAYQSELPNLRTY